MVGSFKQTVVGNSCSLFIYIESVSCIQNLIILVVGDNENTAFLALFAHLGSSCENPVRKDIPQANMSIVFFMLSLAFTFYSSFVNPRCLTAS